MKSVPEIGKIYKTFDDGKITKSRMYEIKIKDIIPFKKANEKLIKQWKEEVKDHDWLYARETDYFCISETNEDNDVEVFVRMIDGRWFSFSNGFLTYSLLDIDGSLYTELIKFLNDNKEQ